MKYIDKDIEKVLHVFEEYLTEEPNLDIQQTKYGYFAIVRVEKKNEKYLWDKLESSADVFRYIFNFIVEKYLYEKQIESLLIPKELIPEFYKSIHKYIEQLPEYKVLLNDYIEKDE